MRVKQTGKPAPRGFDKELAELEALTASFRSGIVLDENGTEHLRKALTHREEREGRATQTSERKMSHAPMYLPQEIPYPENLLRGRNVTIRGCT